MGPAQEAQDMSALPKRESARRWSQHSTMPRSPAPQAPDPAVSSLMASSHDCFLKPAFDYVPIGVVLGGAIPGREDVFQHGRAQQPVGQNALGVATGDAPHRLILSGRFRRRGQQLQVRQEAGATGSSEKAGQRYLQ